MGNGVSKGRHRFN
uniref:Uncharacterized protein n=1 Tax=Rhizophora mucronata TaxID=61149 RepID=A0A2P2QW07_RHIMU